MAATVMTAEFGTIHYLPLVWRNILKLVVVQFFGQTLKLIGNHVNCDISI